MPGPRKGTPQAPSPHQRHSATWTPHRKDLYEQALCRCVVDDARYAAIKSGDWGAGLKLWLARQITACQMLERGLLTRWVEHRKTYRRAHRRPKGDTEE